MAGAIINDPVIQIFDNNGRPLSGGKITTYLSNTTTPASTWQNETLSTLNTNPIQLNSRGECTIWLSPDIQYTFVITDSNNNLIRTTNDIYGNRFASALYINSVDFGKSGGNTIANLVGITPDSNSPFYYDVVSYYNGYASTTQGPQGGGLFVWDSTEPKANHNGGTIISPTVPWNGTKATLSDFLNKVGETQPGGNGCWIRVVSQPEWAEWYGAQGNGVDDDFVPIQHAVKFNKGRSIRFGSGDFPVSATIDMVGSSTANSSFPCGFIGQSRTNPDALSQKGTKFTWTGGAAPFINMGGSRLLFSDFQLEGSSICTAFIQTRFFAGLGFAVNTFKRIEVLNTSYFFLTDAASEEIQSDCIFEFCSLNTGISFMKVNNSFGVNYLLNFCSGSNLTGPALHFVEGGYLVANLFSMRNVQWALKTETVSGDGNAGYFVFNGLYYDGGTQYCGCVQAAAGSIIINGLIVNNSGQTATYPFFDLQTSSARLTVNNGQASQIHSTAFPVLAISGINQNSIATATFNNFQIGSVAASPTDKLVFANEGRYALVKGQALRSGQRWAAYNSDSNRTFYNTVDLSAVSSNTLSLTPVSTAFTFRNRAVYAGFLFAVEAGTFSGADNLEVRITRTSAGLGNAAIFTQVVSASAGTRQDFSLFRLDGLDDFEPTDRLTVVIQPVTGVATPAGLRVTIDVHWLVV